MANTELKYPMFAAEGNNSLQLTNLPQANSSSQGLIDLFSNGIPSFQEVKQNTSSSSIPRFKKRGTKIEEDIAPLDNFENLSLFSVIPPVVSFESLTDTSFFTPNMVYYNSVTTPVIHTPVENFPFEVISVYNNIPVLPLPTITSSYLPPLPPPTTPVYNFGGPMTPVSNTAIIPLPLPPVVHQQEEKIENISYIYTGPIQVIIRPYQVDNVNNLIKIYTSQVHDNTWAMDLSVMGAGKTHVASYLEQRFKWPRMIVICPVNVQRTWEKAQAMYGLPIIYIMSYETLRGTINNGQLPHGLLIRYPSGDDGMPIYVATTTLLDLIRNGTFFVFDEIQKAKNITGIHYAVKAMMSAIRGIDSHYVMSVGPNTSRILITSGTPFDKEKQVTNFLRMLGIIRHRNMLNQASDGHTEINNYGAGELVQYCMQINPLKTREILATLPPTKNNMVKLVYTLYIDVIQIMMTSSMPSPPIEVPIDCGNGYYNLSPERSVRLSKAINNLKKATHYNDGEVDTTNANWGAITSSLREAEYNKAEIFIREAYNCLIQNPKCKVALFFNFKASINVAKELLCNFSPLVLEGSTPKKKRGDIIEKFQSHNLYNRVIISNLTVGALGIDLDDQYGDMPRYAFVSPSYYAMLLHQVTRRFYRANTKSTPIIRLVYGKCGTEETSIINALAKKTQVFRQTLLRQVEEGIKFPGEYDQFIQRDDDPLMTINYYNEILDTSNPVEEDQEAQKAWAAFIQAGQAK